MNQPAAVTYPDAKSFADNKMLSRNDGRVGYVIYNNVEKHNAVSLDMWEAAVGILEDFKNDPNITVVVVTGAGGRAFGSYPPRASSSACPIAKRMATPIARARRSDGDSPVAPIDNAAMAIR